MKYICPYCDKEFHEKTWGSHTFICELNPENIKKEVKKPIAIKKIVRKKRKK